MNKANNDKLYKTKIKFNTEQSDYKQNKQYNSFIDKLNDTVRQAAYGSYREIEKRNLGKYLIIDDTFKPDSKLTLNGFNINKTV